MVFKGDPSNLTGTYTKLCLGKRGEVKREGKAKQTIGTFCLVQWRQADLREVLGFSEPCFSPMYDGDVNYYFQAIVRVKLNYMQYTCHTVGI